MFDRFRRCNTVFELGALNTLLYGFGRLLSRGGDGFLHRYYFVAQPVRAVARVAAHRGKSIEVRRLNQDDSAVYAFGRSAEVIRARFRQGAVCFGAFSQGRIIGYLWLVLGPYLEDEVRCWFIPLPPGRVAWDFDVYLEPQHRLGMGFVRLWDEADAFLRNAGIGWTLSRISAFNSGSLAAHRRLGARHLGSAVFLGSHSWQLMVAGVPPYAHLSIHRERVPQVKLAAPD